ncbi:MAG: hypothetical protein V1738_00415 [Patescibacteria group bacterium]
MKKAVPLTDDEKTGRSNQKSGHRYTRFWKLAMVVFGIVALYCFVKMAISLWTLYDVSAVTVTEPAESPTASPTTSDTPGLMTLTLPSGHIDYINLPNGTGRCNIVGPARLVAERQEGDFYRVRYQTANTKRLDRNECANGTRTVMSKRDWDGAAWWISLFQERQRQEAARRAAENSLLED